MRMGKLNVEKPKEQKGEKLWKIKSDTHNLGNLKSHSSAKYEIIIE